jgi:hypothetical protein
LQLLNLLLSEDVIKLDAWLLVYVFGGPEHLGLLIELIPFFLELLFTLLLGNALLLSFLLFLL